jgi:hypothetical protein
MEIVWKRPIRSYVVATFVVLSFTSVSLAGDSNVAFLFSEDETLEQTELTTAIPTSNALQREPYLNAPMTRLEYMLTRLEASLNEDGGASLRDLIADGFQPVSHAYKISHRITGFARYSNQTGHIIVGYNIQDLGRPKRPMRTTCDVLLSRLSIYAPQANLGFLLHNTVLGVLAQEDNSTYTPVLATFAKHVVQRVTLISQGDDSVMHVLSCQKVEEDGPIQYHRASRKLKAFR